MKNFVGQRKVTSTVNKNTRRKSTMNKTMKTLTSVAVVGLLASVALAEGEPIDLTAAGTAISGYVTTAAGAGIAIFIVIAGVRMMKKGFKAAAS